MISVVPLDTLVKAAADKALALSPTRRTAILHRLLDWVAKHAKPAPTNPAVLERFNAMVARFTDDIGALVNEGLVLHLDEGNSSVRVELTSARYEGTLVLLKRGTSWFEGCHDIDALTEISV